MAEVVVKKEGLDGVEFFGAVDRNKRGERASEVPSWYLNQHKEELGVEIDRLENALRREEIPQSSKPEAIARIEKMRKKMDSINESEPNLSGKQKDEVSKVANDLGKKISDSMFTKTEMMKGLADAHEEARRMADPCIRLNNDELILAKKAGCRITRDGMVSRSDAERTWKFSRRILGEMSNTEMLRRG